MNVSRHVVRIGTRGSLLALKQSEMVAHMLRERWPELRVELVIIKTTGDKITDVPLAKVGGKGLFVKEIEDALMRGDVDLAVHSMKDVPSELPPGLMLGAVPQREDPRDVFVSVRHSRMDHLPRGATVGTSSLRRAAQVRAFRADLRIETLRGNLDTRLRKLDEGRYDAVVLAAAGLHRMGWGDRITAYLDPMDFVPAIGQGALGLEIRRDDGEVRRWIEPLHHEVSALAVEAERAFLLELEGGCQVPIGGYATVRGGEVELTGLVASLDGGTVFKETARAPLQSARSLGRTLGQRILKAGAETILEEIYTDHGHHS